MATATMAVAGGMWRKPNGGAQESAVFSSIQPTGQELRTHSSNSSSGTESVVCRLNEETANVPGRLPGLSEVPRRGGAGRGRRRSRSWHEKRTDSEFDIVIVPSDGCYMSGSDSDDSDWSVGWFEPHPPDFSGNEVEESFGVLVPSYSLSPTEFSSNSTGHSEHKESKTPAWAALLANISNHTDAGTRLVVVCTEYQVERLLSSPCVSCNRVAKATGLVACVFDGPFLKFGWPGASGKKHWDFAHIGIW